MLVRISILALMAAIAFPAGANARGGEAMPVAEGAGQPIQLAQAREVEIYHDRYGREVLVDVYTGEVIAIREPRNVVRPRDFLMPAPREEERYYLDDPDDMARLRRRKRMEELERGMPSARPLPEYRDYRALPDPVYPEDDFAREAPPYEDPWYDEEPRFEQRPDYRQQPQFQQPNTRRLPESRQVERAPLESPSIAVVPDASQPGEIIEEAPGALPDVTKAPELSLSEASADVTRFQVLLDRLGASPGVIDGRMGDNVNKAIDAYKQMTGETLRTYDKEYIRAKLDETGGDAFTTYEITAVDVAGPYVASVPADYGEKAQMERLGYVSVAEMLAERFHMDEKYLRELNPGVNFQRPGTIVNVVNVGTVKTGKVARIVADKGRKQVRAYDEDRKLVAVYPSTIGSQATPSPTGMHTVERVAFDPEYTYNPKLNFKQGNNDKVLTIPPGPNGPVGTIWIALSKPTYGIHGTPDPSKIGKTESNGCIRLTNWDAQELAKMVEKGVTVEFAE